MGLKNLTQNRKTNASSAKVKVMMTVFLFVCGGAIQNEFSPRGHKVNKQYYLEMMKCLREALKGKRTNSRREKKWMLHRNNAPAHSFSSNYTQLSHKAHQTCPTTRVLAPSYTNRLLLVPKVEIPSERSNIDSDDNIHENLLMMLCAFPKKAFQQCSQKQTECREQCIRSAGNYFERDKAK
jgi:hypothetical protein